MSESDWYDLLFGHNQHVISLADFRHAGSIGGLAPITIAQYFGKLCNEVHRSVSEICAETTRELTDWSKQVNFKHSRT